MKVRPDTKTGNVLVTLSAREATRIASELVKAAIASGGAIEDDRPEPTEPDVEEREP
jgi:hypothetical protein